MNFLKLAFISIVLNLASCIDPAKETKKDTSDSKEIVATKPLVKDSIPEMESVNIEDLKSLEIPNNNNSKSKIINHFAYSLQYSEAHEQAYWVAYLLTKDETSNIYERSNNFNTDPYVASGSARDVDYKGSGFDRGHLAPAADMGWSSKSMIESFYYSNMSPQEPGFNRGIWKKLEELVRNWAYSYDSIYIVTGPVLSPGLNEIGPDGVDIPAYYYKVILDYSGKEKKAIGFILPNESSSAGLLNFVVTVDKVESVTGIDFFPNLNDNLENKLESSVCTSCWAWHYKRTTSKHSSNSTLATQCFGTTLKGNRCKRRTKDPSGYCFQHQN